MTQEQSMQVGDYIIEFPFELKSLANGAMMQSVGLALRLHRSSALTPFPSL